MPALSSVTLTDRDAATHVFVPGKEVNGVQTFRKADTNGVPIGESTLSVSLRDTPENRKVRLKLVVPQVQTETINGIDEPKVVRRNWVDCEFTFNGKSNAAEREVLVGMFADALTASQTMLDDVIVDLQGFY